MRRLDKTRKKEEERAKYRKYCECGHSIMFTERVKVNKIICSWCGRAVYKNDFEKFKDKLVRKEKELSNG